MNLDEGMKDEKLTKAVETLFSGAKMLSIHCAECKGPLFEKDGKIFCPICGEKLLAEKPAEKTSKKSELGKVLEAKLDKVRSELEREKDHERVMQLLKEMETILEVLKKLN